MPSAFMPSTAYVAEAIYKLGEDKAWDDAPQDEKDSCMDLARVILAAIQSWQAQHRADGSDRYGFQSVSSSANLDSDGVPVWEIFDKIAGRDKPLGVIHDALLAQQIVDDLNKHDTQKKAE